MSRRERVGGGAGSASGTSANSHSTLARLWIYQAERFPLAKTIPLLGAFSASSVTASAQLAHRGLPGAHVYFVAFLLAFVFFWQMRAMDEVKDAETDRRHRPERPIPRGLVSLRLIVGLAAAAVFPAIAAALWLSVGVLIAVGLVWAWLALMTVEFFAPALLHRSPFLYLISHMAIMPLIDLVLTGCEWIPAAGSPPAGLWTFLWMSLCNGCVVEFGRKIWAPDQERPGVESYTSAWGVERSLLAIALAVGGAMIGLICCGVYLRRPAITTICGALGLAPVLIALSGFRRAPTLATQKRIETWSGVWVLLCYLTAAFSPFLPALA
jgi:4-hydroxybenzoate polyprenyltransferase